MTPVPVPSLDELVANPGRAATLPPAIRAQLLLRCAAVITALSAPNMVDEPMTVKPEADRLLTVAEAAKRLGLAQSYVYELARRRLLPSVRHGKYVRIRERALDEWVRTHEQGGGGFDPTVGFPRKRVHGG